jgi:hypothetical protein
VRLGREEYRHCYQAAIGHHGQMAAKSWEPPTEAVGKPVCGWELAGSRLKRFAETEAYR